MREILFRGKHENGTWLFGSLLILFDEHYIIPNKNEELGKWECIQLIIKYADDFRVFPDSIGQFTGLVDRDGERIFEGDVLLCTYGNQTTESIVEYDDYGWIPFTEQTGLLADLYSEFNYDSFEIIGNIHDNPELLGEQ